MSGMNADRVATSCAQRATDGIGQGLVIVSLQRTQHTEDAQMHIFAEIDKVVGMLAKELGSVVVPEPTPQPRSSTVLQVPYDRNGLRSNEDTLSPLDVSEGAKLLITCGPQKGCVASCCAEILKLITISIQLMWHPSGGSPWNRSRRTSQSERLSST